MFQNRSIQEIGHLLLPTPIPPIISVHKVTEESIWQISCKSNCSSHYSLR